MRPVPKEASSGSPSRPKGFGSSSSSPLSPSAASSHGQLMATTSKSETILYLKKNHATFSAPSKIESVFFDECNREIISLTSGFDQTNKTRVVFQRTDHIDRVEFVLPIEKRILSIKLNSTRTVLAYHVERNTIEFINVHEQSNPADGRVKYSLDNKRYVQNTRAKNSKLIGFLWTSPNDLVIITDLSVEFYHLDSNRHRLNHVKMFQSATNWFVYQPPITSGKLHSEGLAAPCEPYSILMVSTGSLGNSMQPYMFAGHKISRLQRFEVEGSWQDSEKLELFERSITVAHIYGYVRLLVLQHESLNVKSKGAQIVLYTVDPNSALTSKTHTLDLDVSGRFAINILDNMVIAHDQPSKSSFIFDIMIESTEKSDCPNHFVSLLDSRPLRPLQLEGSKPVEMYSLNWVFFQPNFIVDAKLGLLTTLELDLPALESVFQDNNLTLQFLAHRANSSDMIVKKCKQIVLNSYKQATSREKSCLTNPLAEVSATFEHLGRLVISAPELADTKTSQTSRRLDVKSSEIDNSNPGGGGGGGGGLVGHPSSPCASIYQEDIQREIFRELESDDLEEAAHYHFVSSTLLEFIFVVRRHQKNVEFCVYEQLLRCMMRAKRHFQLVQMIRSAIFRDSKQLACSLLSMKEQHRPAAQLGLEMFQRLTGGEWPPANLPLECFGREQ